MNKKMLGNTMWYFGGTIATALLGLISSPVLTRVLSTEVYAQYGMVTTFTTLLATFVYLGQDEAFMRYFDRRSDSYGHFLWRCIRIPLALCFALLFVLLEPSHKLINWVFDSNIASAAAVLLFLYIVFIVVQRFLMMTARMEERAANYSISNIVTKVLFIVSIFMFLALDVQIGLSEIIISLIIGVACALAINILVVVNVDHSKRQNAETVSSKELVVFGLPFAVSSTMFFAVPMIEKIIIKSATDWTVLAIYTSAAIFVTVMNLIKTTVNSIWVPYVYKKYTDKKAFQNVFHNIGIALSWFCLCVLGFVICFRRWLVLVFDSAYFDSNLIAPALVCGACFDLLTVIYSVGINIRKKTAFHIIIPIMQLSISVIALCALLPKFGLRATGISYLLSIAISRITQMAIALHYYNTGSGYLKLVIMMGLYIGVGILTCFYNSLVFDVLCAISLVLIGTATAKDELQNVLKWILGDKISFLIKR